MQAPKLFVLLATRWRVCATWHATHTRHKTGLRHFVLQLWITAPSILSLIPPSTHCNTLYTAHCLFHSRSNSTSINSLNTVTMGPSRAKQMCYCDKHCRGGRLIGHTAYYKHRAEAKAAAQGCIVHGQRKQMLSQRRMSREAPNTRDHVSLKSTEFSFRSLMVTITSLLFLLRTTLLLLCSTNPILWSLEALISLNR